MAAYTLHCGQYWLFFSKAETKNPGQCLQFDQGLVHTRTTQVEGKLFLLVYFLLRLYLTWSDFPTTRGGHCFACAHSLLFCDCCCLVQVSPQQTQLPSLLTNQQVRYKDWFMLTKIYQMLDLISGLRFIRLRSFKSELRP